MPPRASLNSTEREIRLTEVEDVRLASGKVLNEAEHVAIIGRGYHSDAEARAAAKRWRGYIERAFARVNFPADFGDRAPMSTFTEHGRKMMEEQLGKRTLNDDYAMVFQEEPWPTFIRIPPPGISVGRNMSAVLGCIKAAADLDVKPTDRHVLAYDLFSASFWQPSEDSRFMMLMMSLEALIEPLPRAEAVRAHVDALQSLTESAELPDDERQSIIGSLGWLCTESIGQAGKRLARTLGDRRYNEKTPARFFADCYEIRSGLAHGHHPRPSVGGQVATLEQFVGNLLSGELLDAVDLDALARSATDA